MAAEAKDVQLQRLSPGVIVDPYVPLPIPLRAPAYTITVCYIDII